MAQLLRLELLLTRLYMRRREQAPKAHRKTSESGHICLWNVYEELYNRIHTAQDDLGMLYFVPETRSPPTQIILPGIPVGTIEED
jgi:hypothetical protein